jgi:hypothetical protein
MLFKKYSFDFYLLGWAITLYPMILAYFSFKSKWTSKEELRLTFHAIYHPPTFL